MLDYFNQFYGFVGILVYLILRDGKSIYKRLTGKSSAGSNTICGAVQILQGEVHYDLINEEKRSKRNIHIPVKFPKIFDTVPKVFLSISEIDEGCQHENTLLPQINAQGKIEPSIINHSVLRYEMHVDNISEASCEIHFNLNNTCNNLYKVRIAWIAIGAAKE